MEMFWEVLNLSSCSSNLPPLVVKSEVASSSYTIHLSDLTHVWTERINAKDIRKRALNADTSIDPSEDFEQMRLFLQSIKNALEQKSGTSVDLTYDQRAERMLLKTNTPLPGPLRPLRWTFELEVQSPSTLTRELVLPLLHHQAYQNTELTSLVQQLKEKDHIIDKFFDAMQAHGISLNDMFPGAPPPKSAMQSNPRQALSKNAKGLSKFNETQWRKNLSACTAHPPRVDKLLSRVFQPDSLPNQEMITFLDCGEWWLGMSQETSYRDIGNSERQFSIGESQDMAGASHFQRQITPPMVDRRASKPKPEAPGERTDSKGVQRPTTEVNRDDSTTDDEDDLAAAHMASPPAKSDPASNTSIRGPVAEASMLRAKENRNGFTQRTIADTRSPGRHDFPTESIAISNFTHDPAPVQKKAKIGAIGGRVKADPSQAANTASIEQASSVHRQERRQPQSEQANISSMTTTPPPPPSTAAKPEDGPDDRPNFSAKHDSSLATSTAILAPADESGVEEKGAAKETEIERADRNRAQIKRTLAAKAAAAAPAKKKQRRF